MGTRAEHIQDTLEKLGKSFEHVHEFLDQHHADHGGKHRFKLHHKDGVEMVRDKWGDEAALAAECHIRLDCLGRIPSAEDYKTGKVDFLGHGEDAYRVVDKRTGLVVPNKF